jgi:lipid-A-disaccharide synthase
MGSTRLADSGMNVLYDYRAVSLMGISEIFSKLGAIARGFRVLEKHILNNRPSLIILVDFPGFNLRLARFAKKHGVPVVYFIPPQVWAWRKKRIEQIKAYIDRVICILPFEGTLYREHGIDAAYVGHPFMETVKPSCRQDEFLKRFGLSKDSTRITLMPGSREKEIEQHMPIMMAVVTELKRRLPGLTVLIPVAENIDPEKIRGLTGGLQGIILLKNLAYDALAYSDAAVVASGSTTLEAAILGTPTVVIYKISSLSYLLARLLVKVRYISLPNIILGKELFPEFIQHINPETVAAGAIDMLKNGREGLRNDLDSLRRTLAVGDPYREAAQNILNFLEERHGTLFPVT